MTKEVSNKITNTNFILTILIVLLHSGCVTYVDHSINYYNIAYVIQNGIRIICDLAVLSFIAISSYLFFRDFTYKNYKDKIKKRIHTLIIPYFVWSIVFLIYFIAITRFDWIAARNNALGPIDLSLIGIIKAILFARYNGLLWYVRALFVLCLISPIIYFLCTKLKKSNYLIILLLIIVNIFLKYLYTVSIYWLPIFYFVAYITVNSKQGNVKRLIKYLDKYKYLLYIIQFILLIIVSFNMNNKLCYYIYRLLSPLVVYSVVSRLKLIAKKPLNVSKYCFICFCIHYNIVVAIKILLMIMFGNNLIFAFVAQFIACISTLLIVYVIANVMTKYFPKVSKIVFGDRT